MSDFLGMRPWVVFLGRHINLVTGVPNLKSCTPVIKNCMKIYVDKMKPNTDKQFTKERSDFLSQGVRCSGYLYHPINQNKPDIIIVMAHGFGGDTSLRLSNFAETFVQHSMSVYMFDYRTFGESDGEPRQYVNPFCHIQDWKNAIDHVRTMPNEIFKKIVLWGTSFSGGHVLSLAAQDHDISAVIAQVPFVDGLSSSLMSGINTILNGLIASMRDYFHWITWRKPYYIPIVGFENQFAALNAKDCLESFKALILQDSKWENKVTARSLSLIPLYWPWIHSKKIQCPVLIIAAKHDSLISIHSIKWTASLIKQCNLIEMDCNHFDPYTGHYFSKNISYQLTFLKSTFR